MLWTVMWRRLFRVPWTARRSNQSILKEIGPEYSLEGLMLKLKLNTLATWCKELTHWERPWCWGRLKAGGEGGNRGGDGWMSSLTRWTRVWVSSGSWRWTGKPGVLQFIGSQRVGHNWATELSWTDLSLHLSAAYRWASRTEEGGLHTAPFMKGWICRPCKEAWDRHTASQKIRY